MSVVDRRTEARSPGWADAHPNVDVEFWCEWCGLTVSWTAEDLYEHFGTIPLSVEQARALEHDCEWCLGGGEHHRVRLEGFAAWAPGAAEDEDPLVEWDAEDAET